MAGDGNALVADIIGETDRLGRLVSDLLALASAEAGAISLDPEAIDLETWFTDLARRAAVIAEAAGAGFAVSQDRVSDLTVTADRDRLDQLVLILVDNAIKHSPPGGRVQISLMDRRRSGTAIIQVSDQGPGIPAEELERVFEPFVRVPGTRRTTGGTGLGLAIARQLAVRQGAELTVTSSPGAGATFSLSLPLGSSDRPWSGLLAQEATLECAHGGLLLRVGVVPAAEVQGAVRDEQTQLVGRLPGQVPGLAASPLRRLRDGALHRDDDVAQVDGLARRQDEGG